MIIFEPISKNLQTKPKAIDILNHLQNRYNYKSSAYLLSSLMLRETIFYPNKPPVLVKIGLQNSSGTHYQQVFPNIS